MATVLPRHQITETPPIRAAIDAGAKRWPGVSRANVARRLIEAGAAALDERDELVRDVRGQKLELMAARYGDVFEPGYLQGLREEWDA